MLNYISCCEDQCRSLIYDGGGRGDCFEDWEARDRTERK